MKRTLPIAVILLLASLAMTSKWRHERAVKSRAFNDLTVASPIEPYYKDPYRYVETNKKVAFKLSKAQRAPAKRYQRRDYKPTRSISSIK